METGQSRLALAAAIVRTCPSQWSLTNYISYIRQNMRRGQSGGNPVLNMLQSSCVKFLGSFNSKKKRRSHPERNFSSRVEKRHRSHRNDQYERASSEETHFSAADQPVIDAFTETELREETTSKSAALTDNDSVCCQNSLVPVVARPEKGTILHLDIVRDSLDDEQRSCSFAARRLCEHPEPVSSDCDKKVVNQEAPIQKVFASELPPCHHLEFLSAVHKLTLLLDESSAFLPDPTVPLDPLSRDQLPEVIVCVLDHVARSVTDPDVVWLSLLHSLDVTCRALCQCPADSLQVQQAMLRLIAALVDAPVTSVERSGRLLMCLCVRASWTMLVVRTVLSRIDQFSSSLQTQFRHELLQATAPLPRQFSLPLKSTDEAVLDLSGHRPLVVNTDHVANLSMQQHRDGDQEAQRAVLVVRLFLAVLERIETDPELLVAVRPDLAGALRILDGATSQISDRYPMFVSEIFSVTRKIQDMFH